MPELAMHRIRSNATCTRLEHPGRQCRLHGRGSSWWQRHRRHEDDVVRARRERRPLLIQGQLGSDVVAAAIDSSAEVCV